MTVSKFIKVLIERGFIHQATDINGLDYPLKKRKLKKFKNNIIKDFECKIEMFSD